MAFLGNFNAEDVEPTAPREIIPAGKYTAQIVNSEMKATKSGGELLWLEIEIMEGQHAARRVYARLNLVNPNETAVQIAQRELSSICHAIGKLQVQNSEELHLRPMTVTVKVRPEGPDKKGVYREAQNEIGGYAALGGASSAPVARPAFTPPRPGGVAAPVPAMAAAKPAGAPWRNKTAA